MRVYGRQECDSGKKYRNERIGTKSQQKIETNEVNSAKSNGIVLSIGILKEKQDFEKPKRFGKGKARVAI